MIQLVREEDGAGITGPLLVQFRYDTNTKNIEYRQPKGIHDLKTGWKLKVGKELDPVIGNKKVPEYWNTTEVTDILYSSETEIKFQTNTKSIYVLRMIL